MTETTYHFDTTDRDAATGALLVYAVYRSRDIHRYKVTPNMWGQIEGFVRAAAKRARSLPEFVENLKPKLKCPTIHPFTLEVAEVPDASRQFNTLTSIYEVVDHRAVLRKLQRETGWIVVLVRDRLEREKAIDAVPSEPEATAERPSLFS